MKIIAHRGLSSHAPENTLKAFELAGKEQRFFGIECDIHETKDHEFIVMHDANTKRMTHKDVVIKEATLNELREHIIKDGHGVKTYHHQTIPTFDEYLEVCVYHDKTAVIEIKEVYSIESLTSIVNKIENYLGLKSIIISFNLNYLKVIRALSDKIELQLLAGELDDLMIYDCKLNHIDLSLWYEIATKDTIKKLKKEGFKIGVFTVNDTKTAMNFADMGVDYLTTDR